MSNTWRRLNDPGESDGPKTDLKDVSDVVLEVFHTPAELLQMFHL